jgi:hypothetical protein
VVASELPLRVSGINFAGALKRAGRSRRSSSSLCACLPNPISVGHEVCSECVTSQACHALRRVWSAVHSTGAARGCIMAYNTMSHPHVSLLHREQATPAMAMSEEVEFTQIFLRANHENLWRRSCLAKCANLLYRTMCEADELCLLGSLTI